MGVGEQRRNRPLLRGLGFFDKLTTGPGGWWHVTSRNGERLSVVRGQLIGTLGVDGMGLAGNGKFRKLNR